MKRRAVSNLQDAMHYALSAMGSKAPMDSTFGVGNLVTRLENLQNARHKLSESSDLFDDDIDARELITEAYYDSDPDEIHTVRDLEASARTIFKAIVLLEKKYSFNAYRDSVEGETEHTPSYFV